MSATIWKLLALVAVLLLPLGMQPALAAPSAAHRPAAAGMPMQHCPEQGSKHQTKGAFAECTMACSAALPATDLARDNRTQIICVPAEPSVAQHLHGLDPETATPPPRRS